MITLFENPFVDISISLINNESGNGLDDIFSERIEMKKSQENNRHEFEFHLKLSNIINNFNSVSIDGILLKDYKKITNCISGIITIEINNDGKNRWNFFWSCTCLEKHTQSLTFNDENFSYIIQVTNPLG